MADETPVLTQGKSQFRACAESLLWEKRRKKSPREVRRQEGCVGDCHLCFPLSFLLFFIQTWWSLSFQERQKVSPREAGMGCMGLSETDRVCREICFGLSMKKSTEPEINEKDDCH